MMGPWGLMAAVLLLTGCASQNTGVSSQRSPAPAAKSNAMGFLAELQHQFPACFSLDVMQKMVAKGQLTEASRYVNGCLKVAVSSFALHVVNGFLYEEMVKRGVPGIHPEMAMIAYRSAMTLEPNHWLPAYLFGHFELKRKNYADAQRLLADAVVLRPKDTDVLYGLAMASYYVGDLPVALVTMDRALSLRPQDPFLQRAAALIYAASGKFSKADAVFGQYKLAKKGKEGNVHRSVPGDDGAWLAQRIDDWRRTHQAARSHKVNQGDNFDDTPLEPEGALAGLPTIVLSCYVVDLLETDVGQAGNNIFQPAGMSPGLANNALALTLGSGRFEWSKALKNGEAASAKYARNFAFSVSQAQMEYAMNLANAGETRIQYTARPEVVTLPGRKASFVESDKLTGTPPGGSAISVDAGIKVSCLVTNVAADGLITMEVEVTGSSFGGRPNATAGLTNQLIELTKSKVTTTVKAYPGQTVLVAGVRGDYRTRNDQNFPFLRSIPFLQYAFANARTTGSNRNILYLIVPRLGGGRPAICKKVDPDRPSLAAKKIAEAGFDVLGNYSSMYYILKYLRSSPMFVEFRSGDLMPPFWGYGDSSLVKRLKLLRSFLYF